MSHSITAEENSLTNQLVLFVDIPEGYGLKAFRFPKKGEEYLSINTGRVVISSSDMYRHPRPILEKLWKPEVGKVYQFSDNKYFQSYFSGIGKLTRINESKTFPYQVDSKSDYRYCRPIPEDLLGK